MRTSDRDTRTWSRMKWSRRVGLNHRPTVYETVALPLSYAGFRKEVLCKRRVYAIKTSRHHISCGIHCQPAPVFHSQATHNISFLFTNTTFPPWNHSKGPALTYTRDPLLCDMHHTILTIISLYALFKMGCVTRRRPWGFTSLLSGWTFLRHPPHPVRPERPWGVCAPLDYSPSCFSMYWHPIQDDLRSP